MKHLLIVVAVVGCGAVKSGNPDSGTGNGDAPGGSDAAVDAVIDADPCPDFIAPPGSIALHAALCTTALGFNPTVTPDNMTLQCPSTGTATPGTYGKILRPAAIDQVDGCPATQPVTRILAPLAQGSIAQTSTGFNITVAAGSRFRVRVACPAGVANCSSQIQVTGRAGPGGALVPIQSSIPVNNAVVDIDVPMPAAMVGNTAIINLLVITTTGQTPDLLWENPSIGP